VLWCRRRHAGVVRTPTRQTGTRPVDTVELRVCAARNLWRKAKGQRPAVKQSGGQGQYAVCDIEVEPLAEGSGLMFATRWSAGPPPPRVPTPVNPRASRKGVRAQMASGCARRYPVVDMPGHPVEGKAHNWTP